MYRRRSGPSAASKGSTRFLSCTEFGSAFFHGWRSDSDQDSNGLFEGNRGSLRVPDAYNVKINRAIDDTH